MDEIRCAIEIRQDDSVASPGRITGTLLQYGERASDRAERFEAGALRAAVVIDAPLPDTSAGRDGAREIRDGLLPGLSVEFRVTAQRYVDGERRISAALLNGAGLVDDPS